MPTRQTNGGVRFTQNVSAPPSPSLGDEWFNPTTNKLFKFVFLTSTAQWMEIPSANSLVVPTWTDQTRPTTSTFGSLGYNSASYQLEVYGTVWSRLAIVGAPTLSRFDFIVVAGGGSGGSFIGGGGGAGGVRIGSVTNIIRGSAYTITVGAGASAVGPGAGNGLTGSPSSAFGINTTGGGGGGGNNGGAGGNGGSGGGGSTLASAVGLGNTGGYLPVEGFNGGAGSNLGDVNSGGGGGAGGAGLSAVTATTGGDGGIGIEWPTGSGTYYGGGGAGGSGNGATRAAQGGLGGGGNSALSPGEATNGTANTGGGGGAIRGNVSTSIGRAGGSGTVIIRYPSIYGFAASVTGSPIVTNAFGVIIYQFTGNGSITF